MATDWYPSQEGRIADGLTINCIVGATAVEENDIVKFGTSTAGQITVIPATGIGDGWGVAIRAAAVGYPVPILVLGLNKLKNGAVAAAIEQGQVCMNNGDTTVDSCEDLVVGAGTITIYGGNSHILGLIMQTTTAAADEILVLVGRCT